MHNKQDFYRLLGAKHSFDDHLFWLFHYWYEKEFGKKSEFYDIVDVIGYPKDGYITLKFDNDDNKKFDIPLSEMYHDSDGEHQESAIMLWYDNYHDGPLSGMADYKGKKVWFDCVEDEDSNLFNIRRFGLYELTAEEIEKEERLHQLFRDNVGTHCDYVDGKQESEKACYTKESFDKFYKLAEDHLEVDYTKNKLIIELDEAFLDMGYPKKEVDKD